MNEPVRRKLWLLMLLLGALSSVVMPLVWLFRQPAQPPPAPQTVNKPTASRQLPGNFRTVKTEHFRVSFTAQTNEQDVAEALKALATAHADVVPKLAAAGASVEALPPVEVVVYPTTGDFTAATGQPAWNGGVTEGPRIQLQPLATLRKFGILNTTLRHEFLHAVVESLRQGEPAPRWLNEGLALQFSGEGRAFAQMVIAADAEKLEQTWANVTTADEQKSLYLAAYQKVMELQKEKGEAFVWRLALKR
jgi:hypothetical protein